MKRLCIWILAAALVFSLSACSSNTDTSQSNSSDPSMVSENIEGSQETEIVLNDNEETTSKPSGSSKMLDLPENSSNDPASSSPVNSGAARPSAISSPSTPPLTQQAETPEQSTTSNPPTPAPAQPQESEEVTNMNNSEYQVKIIVNGQELTATLDNNATTQALIEKLPMTLPMLDLYAREMCYRFPDALPTDNVRTTGYEVGEIVYWPPRHSFVIMYAQNGERFEMQKIGRINSGVELFDGIGDVEVSFELIDN